MSDEGAVRTLHPHLAPSERLALVARGGELFARGEFFAAHEAWEEIWRSNDPAPRELFQALVQMAAAFHHLRVRGRRDVARRVLGKARARLLRVAAHGAPLDIAALDADLARWERWLIDARGEAPPLPVPRWLV